MASGKICFVLFLLYLGSSLEAARGRLLEDSKLEEELKRLNKPAVEVIQTIHGDTYGCVDFYEQPAFDHPSLKDHKYSYKMPKKKIDKDSSDLLHPKNIWLNGKGCPDGTVPIKRTTKDDLIRAKQAAEIYGSSYGPQTVDNPGFHYGVVHTKYNNHRFNGAGMTTSLYNPKVEGKQFSASHMSLRNVGESIEVGWIVNPTLYNDTQTRLFIFTKSKTGNCFNTDCPGFIYFNTEIPLNMVYPQISTRGGNIYESQFLISKDARNGDWFLGLGTESEQLGSWPSRIFGSLSDAATYAEWGGETYSPPGIPSPPMGSSAAKISENTGLDAYCRQIKLGDENQKVVLAEELTDFTDASPYYSVVNKGNVDSENGYLAYFGGAGGYQGQ